MYPSHAVQCLYNPVCRVQLENLCGLTCEVLVRILQQRMKLEATQHCASDILKHKAAMSTYGEAYSSIICLNCVGHAYPAPHVTRYEG